MVEAVVTEEVQVSAEWLSRVLRAAGALREGRVTKVAAEFSAANWSRHGRLALAYSSNATGECPERLFLKICAGERCVFGPSEVLYYTRDYVGHADAPIPRCYAAAYRETPRAYHLLLEDLTSTHVDGFQCAPNLTRARAIGEAFAKLHAAHWGADALHAAGFAVAGEPELERYFAWIERGLDPLREALGPELDGHGRSVLGRVFGGHRVAIAARAESGKGFTWVHGDPNPGNLMLPRQPPGVVYLIDRQPFDWSLQGWLAASDLAILMVLHWTEEERRELERPVLQHYLEALRAAGADYSWDELFWDYRFSVAQCVEFAVEWCVLPEDRTGMRWLWERQYRRALAAWRDLDCDALFEG